MHLTEAELGQLEDASVNCSQPPLVARLKVHLMMAWVMLSLCQQHQQGMLGAVETHSVPNEEAELSSTCHALSYVIGWQL
jgi:hypothetical protein